MNSRNRRRAEHENRKRGGSEKKRLKSQRKTQSCEGWTLPRRRELEFKPKSWKNPGRPYLVKREKIATTISHAIRMCLSDFKITKNKSHGFGKWPRGGHLLRNPPDCFDRKEGRGKKGRNGPLDQSEKNDNVGGL